MSEEYNKEELARLKKVKEAMANMEGIRIPYNIIKHSIIPFSNWLKSILGEK